MGRVQSAVDSLRHLFPRHRAAEAAGLLGALLWASVLRFGWPGVSPFAYDEAQLSRLALRLARSGVIPVTGMISSAGVPNTPASVWIFAIPFAISTNPVLAVLFVALLNVLSVVGVWWITRKAWGGWAGVASAWLLAGSPYAVFYSRSIWAQDLLIPIAVLWAVSGIMGVEKKDRKALVVHGFAAGFAPQVHYAGFVLPILTVLLGIAFWLGWRWIPLTGGMLASAVISLPMAMRIASGKMRFGMGGHLHVRFGLEGARYAGTLLSGYDWDWLFIGNKFHVSDGMLPRVMGCVLVGMGAIGLLLVAWSLREKKKRFSAAIVLLWAAGAPLFWIAHFMEPRLHYQLTALPGLLVAAGVVVAVARRPVLRLALTTLVIGISLFQGALFAKGIAIAGTKATPGGISTPLEYHLKAVKEARDGKPVVGIVPDTNLRTGGDAVILDVLLWGYPHRLVNGTYSLVWPREASNLLFVGPWMPAWVENEADLRRSGEVDFVQRREGSPYPYVLVRLKGGTSPSGFVRAGPYRLANGVSLLGWRAHALGTWLRFVTVWKVEDSSARTDYHQFNHLYLDDSAKPAMGHDTPTSSRVWRTGDYLITWADFPTQPKGEARMAVGMYEYPSMKRVPRLGSEDPNAPIFLGPFRLCK